MKTSTNEARDAAALSAMCAVGAKAEVFIFTYTETSSAPTNFGADLKLFTTDMRVNGR
jgi:hypothetical protein